MSVPPHVQLCMTDATAPTGFTLHIPNIIHNKNNRQQFLNYVHVFLCKCVYVMFNVRVWCM